MRIFITGVAGFLGSHLADRMIELGHTVIGNDSLIGGFEHNINPKVEFYKVDCCDLDQMMILLKDVDIVYHTAATAHEGLSVFSPTFITTNIFQASVSTISAAIQNKVKRFVFCSSMARYGLQPAPFRETCETFPVDPYGIAKVASENVLKCLAELHGMEWNIAIPHNIIGPRQNYTDPYRNVMSIMINRVLRGNSPIIYGDGTQERCFSYVDDCIFCLEKLGFDPNIVSETFNIGPDEELITINQLADIIMTELSFNKPPIYMPGRPTEVKQATCDSTKAREMLNYQTTTSLIDGIRKTIEYIKLAGPKEFQYSFNIEINNDLTPITWSQRLI